MDKDEEVLGTDRQGDMVTRVRSSADKGSPKYVLGVSVRESSDGVEFSTTGRHFKVKMSRYDQYGLDRSPDLYWIAKGRNPILSRVSLFGTKAQASEIVLGERTGVSWQDRDLVVGPKGVYFSGWVSRRGNEADDVIWLVKPEGRPEVFRNLGRSMFNDETTYNSPRLAISASGGYVAALRSDSVFMRAAGK